MASLKDVKSQLKIYEEKYRNPNLPKLQVSGIYDLFPTMKRNIEDEIVGDWDKKDIWPNSAEKGVYLIFDETLQLLYIGKASMANVVGSRLGSYFKYEKDKIKCRIIHNWTNKPRYVVTIPVSKDMSFEAAALEEYLINTLDPIDNKNGRIKT